VDRDLRSIERIAESRNRVRLHFIWRGEGRSTWIELLVGAAKQRGLQVMTIATRPGKDPLPAWICP